jgi:hypothetical protein
LWISAALLTVVALGVYYASIFIQVRQAHLWTDGNVTCSIVTAFLYLLLCTLMAYGVLRASKNGLVTLGAVWACFLLATLSLTGIGWSVPDSWVKTIGITIPDYTQARTYARGLKDIVENISVKPFGTENDIKDFLKLAESLLEELRKNKDLEPAWARPDPDPIINDINEIIVLTNKHFKLDDIPAIERFSSACKLEADEMHYPGFVPALKRVKNYWINWKRSKGG